MLVKKKWHVFWVQKCKNVQCSEILFQSVFKMFSLRKLKPHVMWLTCTAYMSLICVHTQNILPLLAFKPSGLWQNLFYLGSKISWGKKKNQHLPKLSWHSCTKLLSFLVSYFSTHFSPKAHTTHSCKVESWLLAPSGKAPQGFKWVKGARLPRASPQTWGS